MSMFIKIKKLYCFFFPLCFILNGYATPIPGISLGMFILVLFTCMSLFFIDKKRIKFIPFFIVWFFSTITFFNVLFIAKDNVDMGNIIISLLKLIVWAISISITNYVFFDKQLIMKWMIRFSIICTVYLILQYIFYYLFSIYLPNIFNLAFLPPYSNDYLLYNDFINYSYFRPASFFSEPAFYANFVMVTLVIIMCNESIQHYKVLFIFFSLGVFLSTSTAGIFLTVPLIGIFIIKNYDGFKIVSYLLLFIIVCVCVVSYINLQNDSDIMNNKFLATIKYTLNKTETISDSRRVGDSFAYLNELTDSQKIIGVGFGNEKSYLVTDNLYLNSITNLIVSTGYIGLFVFFAFIFYKVVKLKFIGSKYLLICYLIKCFTSGMAFSVYGILYLSILFYLDYEYRKESHKYVNI